MKRKQPRAVSMSAGFLLILSAAQTVFAAESSAQIIDPDQLNANTLRLLEENKQRQLLAAKNWRVFHDFQFVDRYDESGIRFQHHAVDDASKYWKPAHYDHGSGIAAAHVDGDGRLDIYFVNQLGGN